MTFNNGSPQNFSDWIDDGFIIIPCKNKVPVVKWKDENFKSTKDQWAKLYKGCNIGLKLVGLTDIDIDNHFVKKFIEKYLKSCGSIYGRETNPRSHYLFLGELNSKKFCLPDELSEYFKGFPHGSTILEIRSGKGHQSIVPNSIIDKDFVAWDRFAKINSYEGDLESDIGKIALSSALSILYPLEGKRDDYCTAIAGVLAKHTDWNEDAINEFVYNLAVLSGSRNPERYMSKGTNAKKSTGNKFGMPTIAEKVGCSVKTISELFSWVGVKDSGSLFKELRVYKTEPKYWQIKYKDQWITVMHTSELSAYSKISNLIMENCYELAPAITPKEWRAI